MILIGIDPGKSGGIAWHDGEQMRCSPLFPSADSTETDLQNLIKDQIMTLGTRFNRFAYMELVHSSPQMGVKSAFTFGQCYGFLRGVLRALDVPSMDVRPQLWMQYLALKKRPKETDSKWKGRLKARAQELYPYISRQITLKTADAVLIAHYALTLQTQEHAHIQEGPSESHQPRQAAGCQ